MKWPGSLLWECSLGWPPGMSGARPCCLLLPIPHPARSTSDFSAQGGTCGQPAVNAKNHLVYISTSDYNTHQKTKPKMINELHSQPYTKRGGASADAPVDLGGDDGMKLGSGSGWRILEGELVDLPARPILRVLVLEQLAPCTEREADKGWVVGEPVSDQLLEADVT